MQAELQHCWYLLRTRTAAEGIAQRYLERQGFCSYYPRLMRRTRIRGQRVRQLVPLFPRYLFLQLLIGLQDFSPVRATRGVVGIVRFGETFATVPDEIVDYLRSLEDPSTGLHQAEDGSFKVDSPVRITEGPFEGLQGTFLQECGEDRVLVLMTLLGHATPVMIAEEWVSCV